MNQQEQQLIEMLADRSVGALDSGQVAVLDNLLETHREWDDDSFELAAAAADLAMLEEVEPMPQSLESRLQASSAEFLKSLSISEEAAVAPQPQPTPFPQPVAAPIKNEGMWWTGWVAAIILLGIALASMVRPAPEPIIERVEVAPEPILEPTAAQRRTQLMAQTDVITTAFQPTGDDAAAAASGDVVWSPSQQEGYMRITGLEANNPNVNQYQLWIFDSEQDERYPIDGGVFDIPDGADEVIVPIDAKLFAVDPTLYAITVEKPGGVVVSARERIVLVANPKA